jgi:glycerol-3-phosphate dehydrogenase (NAD(P)+)
MRCLQKPLRDRRWVGSRMLEREGQSANGALMHNLAAALFAQALTELSILVDQLGGDRSTVAGLADAGDLYVTCQGGRNGRLGRLLGQGLTYSKAKSEHIMTDTVEGAELAFTIEPILDAMVAEGGLPGNRMHLTSAIVGAICGDEPLDMPWMHFHRGS